MAKTIRHSNYRVEFPVYISWKLEDHDYCVRESKLLLKEIDDHVPEAENGIVAWDTEVLCEHCGYTWEEDDDGCPVCCNKAVEEWEADNAPAD